ncbi:uncharacterized protein LOC143101967 isoform X2 [Alosa pseudoharengus]|uniref:uncharacterized protein LOC143101967 isoform X2 n=1 Tax=Alosa pseudoharengus TaxID=34774 RepID=UPI003F8BB3ED
MDEAEKYQQRLQAIAEKRRQQEEEERLRREVEEEWLKLAQRKRKSLRDQWLMDMPNAPATDGPEPPAPLWPPAQRAEGQDEGTEEDEGNAQEEEEEEDETTVQDGRQTNSTENNVSTGENTDEKESQGEVEETAVPSHTFLPMQNGGEDRSVLGMLEVRVERDLRTGASVVKTVAALPPGTPPGATPMETVFDDGRKCVRAVSGGLSGACEASAEDLDQVLNTLAEVGVPVLLEARGLVAPSVEGLGGREEVKVEEEAEKAEGTEEETEVEEEAEKEEGTEVETEAKGEVEVGDTEEASEDQRDQAVASESSHKIPLELEPKEDSVNMREESVGDADGVWEKGESGDEKVIDTEEEEEEEEEAFRPEEGLDPITLTFLGFSQAASEPGQGNGDDGSLVRIERVLIRDYSDEEEEEEEEGREGEEYDQYHELASPDMDISHTSTSVVVGSPERQLEAREEMDDPGLEPHLGTQNDRTRGGGEGQGGGDTEEERHRGAESEALELVRVAWSEPDPDMGALEAPLHLSVCPTLGARTEGAEMEGEMGRGEGAVEKESLDDVFQDVTLDDTQTSAAQDPESQPPVRTSSGEPSRAEGVGSPKHNTCQCCAVM